MKYQVILSFFIFLILALFFTGYSVQAGTNDCYRFNVTFTGTGTYSCEHSDLEPCYYCKNRHCRKLNMNFSWKVFYPVFFSESNIQSQKNSPDNVPLSMARYPSDIVCSFSYEEGFCEIDGSGNSVYINHKVTDGHGKPNDLAVYIYADKSKTPGYYDFKIESVNGFILQGDFQSDDKCNCTLKGAQLDQLLENFIYSPNEQLRGTFSVSLNEIKSGKPFKKNVACTSPHPPTGYDPDPTLVKNDLAWTGTVLFEPVRVIKK
ncbi:MAG: hypothetical protein ABRQ39_32365 [Candidatus Eremiobacterota bacterium]